MLLWLHSLYGDNISGSISMWSTLEVLSITASLIIALLQFGSVSFNASGNFVEAYQNLHAIVGHTSVYIKRIVVVMFILKVTFGSVVIILI